VSGTVQRPAPRFGALFDWDGIVVDSKALHQAAWDEVAREFGYPHGPAEFRRHFGTQNWRAISEILRWTEDPKQIERISARKEELYRRSIGNGDLAVPGVREMLEALRRLGVPCAVVSSSPRLNIEHVLGSLGIAGHFCSIVTAEDCRLGKPEPEGFLLGAERLGLPASRCVVFEDAPAGIEAGRRAGARVLALATTHAARELCAADVIAEGWSNDLVYVLQGWFP
jgi:HAD superfamily hydrolase (TIGR01509 family)